MSSARLTAIWTIACLEALATPVGAVLCKTRNDTLVVRSGCRRHEKQIDPGNPLFNGAKGDPGDAGPQGAGPGVHVVDSNGKDVGVVLNSDGGSALVLRQIGSDLFTFRVGAHGLIATLSPVSFYYTRADCQPPAYLLAGYTTRSYDSAAGIASDAALAHDLFVDEAGTAGYFTETTEALEFGQTTLLYHRLDSSGQGCVQAYDDAVSNGVYRPVHAVDLGALGLSPPFAIRR